MTGARGRALPDAPEVAEAFPDDAVRVRFLLDGPTRQRRTRRATDIAVEA